MKLFSTPPSASTRNLVGTEEIPPTHAQPHTALDVASDTNPGIKELPCENNTPSTSSFTPSNNCERCRENLNRVVQLQDSCRKIKQRRALLQMEIKHLKKTNKELRKVSFLYPDFI